MLWLICMSYFFSFMSYNKILRTIDLLFNSNIFQSFLFDEKSSSCLLYWSIKGLIFVFLCGSFLICSWFNATSTAYWKHLSSLFFGYIVVVLFFSHLGESICDLPLIRLFYGIYNAINQHYQKNFTLFH